MTGKPQRKKRLTDAFTAANDNQRRFQYKTSAQGRKRALNPPTDNKVVEVLHDVPVSDPFRPLEKIDDPETVDWVVRQNKKFYDYVSDQMSSIAEAKEKMRAAADYRPVYIPRLVAGTYFTGSSFVATAPGMNGPWTYVLRPEVLHKKKGLTLKGWAPSPDGTKIAYRISKFGSDAETIHVLDLTTGKLLKDTIAAGKMTPLLWEDNNSFRYIQPANDGQNRKVEKRHTLGTDPKQDPVLFDPHIKDADTGTEYIDKHHEWMYMQIGTDKNHGLFVKKTGSNDTPTEIIAPKTFAYDLVRSFDDGTMLAQITKNAPRGKLVRFHPLNETQDTWQTVIPEHPVDILRDVRVQKDKILAHYLHDGMSVIRVYDLNGQYLHDVPIPPESTAKFEFIGSRRLIRISNIKTPDTIYDYDADQNTLTPFRTTQSRLDLSDCIVERVYATSKDGTKVPMTVVRHPNTKLDGSAALKLEGYGGFDRVENMSFDMTVTQFVRAGGVYAFAHVRGDGGFGQDWYNQGRCDNKQNVFDDFIACSEHLIAQSYTNNKRLVIEGGSNGGLLTAAVMVQRPDLFGAVISNVPVTDMFRYHLNETGSNWKSDYGDPDIKKDFNSAAAWSPLHNIKQGQKFPPHLITTASHDDRVMPWHAFKLAATLQSKGHKDNISLLYTEGAGSHSAPTFEQYLQNMGEVFAFIEKSIGPIDQASYQHWLRSKAENEKIIPLKKKKIRKNPRPKP